MNKKNNLYKNLLVVLILFLFYFFIAYSSPLSCDDWVWGSKIGIQRLNSFFSNYNGRYLGDLTILLLTRSVLIKALVMGIVNTAIVFTIGKIVWGNVSVKKILSVFLLLLILPTTIFSQTYGWASGFSNYNLSVLFILLELFYFKYILVNSEDVPNNKKIVALLFISGLLGQLLAEHVTIYNLIFSIGILIAAVIQKKKKTRPFSFFLGVLTGTLMMFSNSSYYAVAVGTDTYRTISNNLNLFERMLNTFTTYMYKELIFNNTLLNIFLSVIVIMALLLNEKKSIMKDAFIFYLTVFPLYKLFVYDVMNITFTDNNMIVDVFNSAASVLFILVIGFSILLFTKKYKNELIFYLVSFALVASPLFFVTPLSSRVFLASYVFLVLLGTTMLKSILENGLMIKKYGIQIVFYSMIFLLCGIYMVVFAHIGKAANYRIDYIESKVESGSKEIKLWRLPHEQFLYESTFNPNGYMEKNFRRYYHIPDEVKFKRSE